MSQSKEETTGSVEQTIINPLSHSRAITSDHGLQQSQMHHQKEKENSNEYDIGGENENDEEHRNESMLAKHLVSSGAIISDRIEVFSCKDEGSDFMNRGIRVLEVKKEGEESIKIGDLLCQIPLDLTIHLDNVLSKNQSNKKLQSASQRKRKQSESKQKGMKNNKMDMNSPEYIENFTQALTEWYHKKENSQEIQNQKDIDAIALFLMFNINRFANENQKISMTTASASQNASKLDDILRNYVFHLPQIGSTENNEKSPLHQSFLWSDEEVEWLKGSKAYYIAKQLKVQVKEDYDRIVSSLFKFHPDLFQFVKNYTAEGPYSYEQYQRCVALVWSRTMDFQNALEHGKTLRVIVPFADFFNSRSSIRSGHFYSQKKQVVGIIATKEWKAGEEIFINYGPMSNSRMLQLYGYVIENNENDAVELYTAMRPPANMEEYARIQAIMEILKMNLGKKFIDFQSQPFLLTMKDPLPDNLIKTLAVQRGISIDNDFDPTDEDIQPILEELKESILDMIATYSDSLFAVSRRLENRNNLSTRELMSLLVKHGELSILHQTESAISKILHGDEQVSDLDMLD